MDDLHLIVGLGNPGREYAGTRHNIGVMLCERLGANWKAAWNFESKFDARLASIWVGGKRVLLCEPMTFMNASGKATGAVMKFYRVEPERTLVVSDDADLPLGQIRLRASGGTGGHRGLESVWDHMGTDGFPRLRIGIGRRADGVREITGHVLGRFGADETPVLDKVLDRAARQAETWVREGIEKAMCQFNGAISGSEEAKETE
jgi:PTH1 family peptidyl-tRNA hydrolase